MIKRIKKVSIILLMSLLVLGGQNQLTANAAPITGQDVVDQSDWQGWTTYNDTDSDIVYDENWKQVVDEGIHKDYHVNEDRKIGAAIKFKFYGTKLRIVPNYESVATVANIKIDGQDYGDIQSYIDESGESKFFRVYNLEETEHEVVITTVKNINGMEFDNAESSCFELDAIEIDETGKLIPYVEHRANLTLYMNNGSDNKYDLTVEELDSFLAWYDEASKGNGSAYYVLHREAVDGSLSNDDYIPFSKIEYFNVQKYDK